MGGLGQGTGAELVLSAPLNHWNITPLTPLHSARAKLAASAASSSCLRMRLNPTAQQG